MKHTPALLILTLTVAALTPRASAYDAILTTEHVDLGLGYTALGGWDLHVHDEDNAAEYAPAAALLYASVAARINRPAGAQFDFIGVGAGQQFWLLPLSQNPNVLFLGIGAEEVETGSFASYLETDARVNQTAAWMKLALREVRGPGEVSLWSNDNFGAPKVWWSSDEGGITASDAAFVVAQSHAHFNWGFTAPGLYEVDVEASAFRGPGATNPTASGVTTYHFGIEAVPEPGSTLLLSLGTLALAARRRRAG